MKTLKSGDGKGPITWRGFSNLQNITFVTKIAIGQGGVHGSGVSRNLFCTGVRHVNCLS